MLAKFCQYCRSKLGLISLKVNDIVYYGFIILKKVVIIVNLVLFGSSSARAGSVKTSRCFLFI